MHNYMRGCAEILSLHNYDKGAHVETTSLDIGSHNSLTKFLFLIERPFYTHSQLTGTIDVSLVYVCFI